MVHSMAFIQHFDPLLCKDLVLEGVMALVAIAVASYMYHINLT